MGPRGPRSKKSDTKISEKSLKLIRAHIEKFCRYKSHHSAQEYILCVDSVEDMYASYKKECLNTGITPEKIEIYRDMILNTEFKISFEIPLHQPCPVCSCKEDRDVSTSHKNDYHEAYKEYEADLKEAKVSDGKTEVITMSMLPSQPLPVIREADEEFPSNRWQLLVHSFIMHSCVANNVNVCVWPEYIGSCGTDELVSCILKVLPTVLARHNQSLPENLIVWTDSDIRNKNYTLIFLWIYVIFDTGLVTNIKHKFFPTGHTKPMNTDKDFQLIEKKMRQMQCVWTHFDWMRVIQKSKKVGKAFNITELLTRDVTKTVMLNRRFTERETLINGKDSFNIADTTAFHVSSSEEGIVEIRRGYSDAQWDKVDVRKRGKLPKKPMMIVDVKYPEGRRIHPAKYSDLMKTLPYVPLKDGNYFKTLSEEGGRGKNATEDEEYLYVDDAFDA